jgi:RNA polymerase sigma factor (sigma-70 family)
MYKTKGAANGAAIAPLEDHASGAERKAGGLARARRAMLSDDRLAKQAAAGDVGAFETIFSRYRDDLYRFCVGILREPQDAQDAVQNTMIRAMRALPGERRAMKLKPWLYRIAHNEAVELRRRERPVEELPVTVDDVGALTDERAEENGRLRTLLGDIADLPERQRASLVLREVNGLGFGEIGAALGTSPGAVRQALYEARRGLAEMDNGRDMRCDRATRMVSDADGRPRDRAVRAHLRDCSSCRRFQTEIKERGRTFAAISPLPAIVVAGAVKAVLGGSGAAAGGSGTAAVAGGAGAGAGAGVVGSLGAAALVKPAAGLLVALAVGTAAVDRGAVFEADQHGPAPVRAGRSAPPLVRDVEGSVPTPSHAMALRHVRGDAEESTRGTIHPSSTVASAPTAVPTPAAQEAEISMAAPRPRAAGDPGGADEVVSPTVPTSPVLDAGAHVVPVVPTDADPVTVPANEDVPPGQAQEETIPPGEVSEPEVETTAEPATESESTAPESAAPKSPAEVPPGQAKKEAVPPGQAREEVESAPAVEPTEAQFAGAPVETTEAPKVPPGQAKKEEAATE